MRIIYRQSSFILLFFLLALITSCTTTSYVTIEILKPSTLNYHHAIRKIVVVNCDNDRRYTSIKYRKVRHATDSLKQLLTNKTIDGFLEVLQPVTRFDTIVVYDHSGEFNLSEAKKIAKEFNADGVIALVSSMVKIYKNAEKNQPYYTIEYSSVCDLNSKFVWKLYDARTHDFLDDMIFKYNDIWEFEATSLKEAFSKLPVEKKLAEELFTSVGTWAGKKVIPRWTKENRLLYDAGNKDMQLAYKMAANNNWKAADSIWSKYSECDSKLLSRLATYNKAQYYEMQGDIDKAFDTATKCYKEFGDIKAKYYADQLHQRRMDNIEINRQLKH